MAKGERRGRINRVEELRKMLAEEYGIHSDAELEAALKKAPKIDIFAMAGSREVSTVKGQAKAS